MPYIYMHNLTSHIQFAPDYLCQPFFVLSLHSPQDHAEYVKKVLSNKRKKNDAKYVSKMKVNRNLLVQKKNLRNRHLLITKYKPVPVCKLSPVACNQI